VKTKLDALFADFLESRGLRQSDIARRMCVDQSALTRRLERLRLGNGSLKTLALIAWALELDKYESDRWYRMANMIAAQQLGVFGTRPELGG